MNLDKIGYAWDCSPYSGWGVIGINFSTYWPGEALSVVPGAEGPPWLADNIHRSRRLVSRETSRHFEFPVFVGLGNELAQGVATVGSPSIAFPVFEKPEQVKENLANLSWYRRVITASQWNHDVLAEMGVSSTMVHQGYDPKLFHPGIRRPRKDGRFRVFSGGKAEWRKGQDLVLQGFKIFAEKHDDAVLHAAWSSPFSKLAGEFANSPVGSPLGFLGRPNFPAWAQRNGIKPHQFVNVPLTPNHLMPDVLADMDCAVFASRVEGGTNIAAMECIASGIPTIVSNGTGHDDLPAHFWADNPEQIADGLRLMHDLIMPLWGERVSNWATGIAATIADFAWPARIAELVEVLKDV